MDDRKLFTSGPIALSICFGLVVVIFVVAFVLNHRPVKQVVTSFFADGGFDIAAAARLEREIVPLVARTRFQEKINVKTAPRIGYLNFYVAKERLPGVLSALKCNCAYVGSDIIICDHAFLETFSSSVNYTPGSIYGEGSDKLWKQEAGLFEKVNRTTAAVLRAWIIGHEIGHAVLHEQGSSERRIIMTRDKENAADMFFLEKATAAMDRDVLQKVSWGLNQLISQILVIAYRDGKARIAPSSDGVHEPWIVRAIALGQRLTDRSGEPDNDFYRSLSQAVSVEHGGTAISSLCEFQNLREQAARVQQQR